MTSFFKKIGIVVLGSLFFCGFSSMGLTNDAAIASLEAKTQKPFVPPQIRVHTFKNGIKLYFLERKDLPVFEMSAMIHAGSIHDPENKKGLMSLLMSGLRTGGTTKYSGEQVDALLEQVAASLDIDLDAENSYLKIKSLSKDQPMSLEIFFDILKNPRFDPAKIELSRQKILDSIVRRNENPMGVAKREFLQQLYGESSVWARVPTKESVEVITLDDIKKSYQSLIVPKRISLAVCADVSFDELVTSLEKQMADWAPVFTPLLQVPFVIKEWRPSVTLINKPSNQSSIVLGHFGDKRFNPDKYALTLANFILGGSTFGSRLGNHIRSTLGLAYGVSSVFGLNTDYGPFQIFASTKTASTVDLILETKKILYDMLSDKPITDAELKAAKETIINQIIFEYEDPMKIVEIRRFYDYYGYPENYLEIYQQAMGQVSVEQVNDVLKKYFFPDKFKVLIVGTGDQMPDLSKLGEVTTQVLDNQ